MSPESAPASSATLTGRLICLVRTHLPCVVLPFLLLVLIPAFLLKQNIDSLGNFAPRAFLAFLLTACAASVLLLSISLLLERTAGARPFSLALEYLCFFVVLTGFVLPVSERSGMKDASRVGVSGLHLLLATILALTMLLISKSRYRRPLLLAIVLFVTMNAASTVPAFLSLSRADSPGQQSIFEVSSEKSIFVMSFDGVPGWAAREVLNENPELEREFRGFVFFDRVASSSPATAASTAASLYGNRNFKEEAETEEDLWKAAPHWLLTNNLNGSGYVVSTYGIYNTEFTEVGRRHSTLAPRPPESPLMLLDYSIARSLTRFAVPPTEWTDRIERRLTPALSPLSREDQLFLENVSSSRSPKWKRKVETPTLLDFHAYVRKLHLGDSRPSAHFLHFTYSHFPVEFNRTCRFMGHDREWFKQNQNWRGVKEEVFCVLTQAATFIGKLRQLGVDERALVVLKSDHGKPVKYGKPGRIEALRIRGSPMWGYGRYRPFLAIKGFGPAVKGVQYDQHPVMLDDLAKTLCLHAGVDVNCSAYSGFDLLEGDFREIDRSEVTVFVVVGTRADYRFDNHEAITIRRGTDVVESLRAALTCLDSGERCVEDEP